MSFIEPIRLQAAAEPGQEQPLTRETVRAVRKALLRWGRAHFADYPWRQPLPLWQALIAEVMLLRTRAQQVVPVFEDLRTRYDTPAAFARAGEHEIRDLVRPLGLAWRGALLTRLARSLDELGGELPDSVEGLQELPGVGPYAAAATLSLHSNRRAALIDANTVRVVCRLLGRPYDGETRRKRWLRELMEELTPPRAHRAFNYALLDLAMTVCKPRRPKCERCPLQRSCATGQQRSE